MPSITILDSINTFRSSMKDTLTVNETFKELHAALKTAIANVRNHPPVNHYALGLLNFHLAKLLQDFPLIYTATFPQEHIGHARIDCLLDAIASMCIVLENEENESADHLLTVSATMLTQVDKADLTDPQLPRHIRAKLNAFINKNNDHQKNAANRNSIYDRVREAFPAALGVAVGAIAYYNFGLFKGALCGAGATAATTILIERVVPSLTKNLGH